jgi:anaerobic magnesium-protoporphyrin IX monomethyl ester cyclase
MQSTLERSASVPTRPQSVALVSVGAYTSVYGLRKLAPVTRALVPETKTYYVLTGAHLHSVKNVLLSSKEDATGLQPADLEAIGRELARYDLVGLSAMTIDSDWAIKVIAEIKKANPECYVVWGGMHAIVCPDECIEHADAVCTGEGDLAWEELLERLVAGRDVFDTENFWFRRDGEVVKNGFRPLMTPDQMGQRPHLEYADAANERIYERGEGFVPLKLGHYLDSNGLSYHTIWTQGCPYRCTYCGNTAFLAIDKKYASVRQTPVDYIVEECKAALEKHPHIRTFVFDDDCMAALPVPVLEEFAEKWRREVDVPFFVAGVIPSFVDREKLEILLEAGMNRMRMGIQSGSDAMLKFFKRPNKPGLIHSVARTLGDYSAYMIPPAFDIIVDIPVEEKADVEATLRLVHDMPRPFTLSVFSLRLIPGTELEKQIKAALDAGELEMEGIDKNYHSVAPTMANALLYLDAAFRLPDPIFEYLLRFAKPAHAKQVRVPILLFFCRAALYGRRGLYHLRFMDFSVLPGKWGYRLWKIGFIDWWHRNFVKRFRRDRDGVAARPDEVRMPAPRTYSATAEATSAS